MSGLGRTAPPPPPHWFVDRPRLTSLLDGAWDHRLTTVIAGAGFGKSSLLASWSLAGPAAWLTVTGGDASLATLVPSLVAVLGRLVPSFAVDPALVLGGASEAESAERADAIAAHIAEALDRALSPEPDEDDAALLTIDAGVAALVLDDIHRLRPTSPGARLIEAVTLQAPASFHVVVAGRDRVPFPIERLRGRGEVVVIGPADLAFTVDEVGQLVTELVQDPAPDLAGRIVALTNGWPAAVRLAIEAIRRDPTPQRLALESRPPRVRPDASAVSAPDSQSLAIDADLFDYLAEEVFASERPELVEFVRRISIVPRFTLPMAEAIVPDGARASLDTLLSRGLFVISIAGSDGWFTVHALVRRYARARLPLEPEERRNLLARVAAWLELAGHDRESAEALAALGDADAIAQYIGRRGRELIAAGGAAELVELDAGIPPDRRLPAVDEIVGEALLVVGELDAARSRLELLIQGGERLESRVAWLLGRVHWERGELAAARDVFARAVVDGTDEHDALVLSYLASAHWALGDVAACRATAERAMAVARERGDQRSMAAALNPLAVLTIQTDPPAAIELFRRGLAAAHAAGDVFQLIRLATNLGTVLESQGRYSAAIQEQDESVRLAELLGWPAALATSLRARGFTRFRLGLVDEAMADLEAARATWERIGSSRVTWALRNLGWAHRQRGAIAPARAALDRAMQLATRQGDVQTLIFVRADLARLLADEDPDAAARLAADAVDDAERLEYAVPDARLAAGWVALLAGDRPAATAHAVAAAAGGRLASEPATLAEALELQALACDELDRGNALLDEALTVWTELGDVPGRLRAEVALGRLSTDPRDRTRGWAAASQLRTLGFRLDQAARVAGVLSVLHPGGHGEVAVHTLGGFGVIRDGRRVGLSEWRSRKARDLLKLLISRRGRPAPRETLMEALWPDEDPTKLANRLSVAIATLRAVLDPDHRHSSDRYVAGDAESVWLRPGALSVDVESFLADTAAALAEVSRAPASDAIELLESAEAAFAGDFLEEDPYAEWAAGLREQVRSMYLAALRALMHAADTADDADAATRYGLRILERDPYDEDAHLVLVTALDRGRRRGEARRRYRLYVAAMRELDVEPVPFPAG